VAHGEHKDEHRGGRGPEDRLRLSAGDGPDIWTAAARSSSTGHGVHRTPTRSAALESSRSGGRRIQACTVTPTRQLLDYLFHATPSRVHACAAIGADDRAGVQPSSWSHEPALISQYRRCRVAGPAYPGRVHASRRQDNRCPTLGASTPTKKMDSLVLTGGPSRAVTARPGGRAAIARPRRRADAVQARLPPRSQDLTVQ
jgi:hypothetical protein